MRANGRIFRVEKNGDYTCMSNVHLRDDRLSLGAKGLLSVILALPEEDWHFSKIGLQNICKEGREALENRLKELKDCGYIRIVQHRDTAGHWMSEWIVRETPDEQGDAPHTGLPYTAKPGTAKPDTVEPCTAEPSPENPYTNKILTSSTEGLSTYEESTKKKDVPKSKRQKSQRNIIPPQVEWIKEYCRERESSVDAERFFDYYESNGWKVGKSRMKDWQASVRTWERMDRERQSKEQQKAASQQYGKYGAIAMAGGLAAYNGRGTP
jgi:hypothetical protein